MNAEQARIMSDENCKRLVLLNYTNTLGKIQEAAEAGLFEVAAPLHESNIVLLRLDGYHIVESRPPTSDINSTYPTYMIRW